MRYFVKISCETLLPILIIQLLADHVACLTEATYKGKKYVSEGSPFTIACIRSSYSIPKWIKDGITINPSGDYELAQEMLSPTSILMTLEVNYTKWKHRGIYKCDPLDTKGHKIEVVPLKESDKEMILQPRVKLRPGRSLTLQCGHQENGVFPINWYKDGNRILESEEDPRIQMHDKNLVISPANVSDFGDYLCIIEVSGLSYPAADHLGSPIKVTYPAFVEQFPSQIRPIMNRNLSLECKVQGFPAPRITWFIDRLNIEIFQNNDSRFNAIENSEGLPNAILFIENIEYDDNHVITCYAENMDGAMESTTRLAVRENKINTNEKFPGQGIILTPGADLSLQCNNTDDPSSEMSWYKNGSPVNLTDTRLHVEKYNNTLTIEKTLESDTGSYMCVTPDMINATIVVRTEVKLGPFDNSRNVVQGQSIILICNVTQGVPLPQLQWYKNDELVNTSDSRITLKSDQRGIEGTELIISEAEFEDRADYMCVATNDVNSVNATILVRVKDKYAALWPFLGICAEVAVLCTIIFIYEKKRQKPDYDESETEHNTENKNIPDQEEKSRDIRQRK